jgi:diketogulonate reductase-like aldo/keto reductase
MTGESRNLQMEYLDLYLIHMPVCQKPGPPVFPARREDALPFDFKGVWQAMEECQRLGLAKAICRQPRRLPIGIREELQERR